MVWILLFIVLATIILGVKKLKSSVVRKPTDTSKDNPWIKNVTILDFVRGRYEKYTIPMGSKLSVWSRVEPKSNDDYEVCRLYDAHPDVAGGSTLICEWRDKEWSDLIRQKRVFATFQEQHGNTVNVHIWVEVKE